MKAQSKTLLTRTLLGIAVGGVSAYFLDPRSGRRRRALVADQLCSVGTHLYDEIGVAQRDIAHRLRGMAARTRATFQADHADDEIITERVRAALGRAVSHPSNIEVKVRDGAAVLSGDILTEEYDTLLETVRRVRGIKSVTDHLAVYDSARGISSLQGGRERRPQRFELMQENWSPAARVLTGATASALILLGLQRSSLVRATFISAGAVLMLRSSTNMPLKRLAGAQGRRAIDIHKTMVVHAPVQRVFELLDNAENFPFFMRNVREVKTHEDGRSHWTVAGPANLPVEWDSVVTVRQPNELLGWRTVPNAIVAHAGIIRLTAMDNGRTQVDIRMSYNPPAGALGHMVAKLFGADPKSEMDQDLVRMKHFLETGQPPRDAAAPYGAGSSLNTAATSP
jgi:uncharacterized membrane protein